MEGLYQDIIDKDDAIIDILNEIKSILLKKSEQDNDNLLSIVKATQYTGLSPSTIRRSVKSGDLKFFRTKGKNKLRGKLLFKKSHLTNWLTSQGGE